jgi:phosphoglucomutase
LTKEISRYHICPDINVDIGKIGTSELTICDGKKFTVEVIDSIEDYLVLMKEIFNFDEIKNYLKSAKILVNAMHGVTGNLLPNEKRSTRLN